MFLRGKLEWLSEMEMKYIQFDNLSHTCFHICACIFFIFLHKFSVSMLKSLIMIKACVYLTHKNTHLTWEFKYGKNFTSSWWKERRLKAFSYQSSFLVLMLADDRALKNVCIRKSERKLFHPYFSQRSKKKQKNDNFMSALCGEKYLL